MVDDNNPTVPDLLPGGGPVAIIEPVGGHAGMNSYDMELCRGLSRSGIHCLLFTCDETEELSEPGVTVLTPFRGIYGEEPKVLRGLKYLRGLFSSVIDARRQGVRVAHLHYFQYGLRELACCLALKLLGIRVVATVHDVHPLSAPEGIDLFRTVIRLGDHLIVHNHFSQHMLIDKVGASFPLPPVSVINIGNFLGSIRVVDKIAARRALQLPVEDPLLLFFGQIKPEKGLQDLLRAFALHRQRGGAGRLVVAGRPTTHDPVDYEEMAHQLGLSAHVDFRLAYIPDEEMDMYFCAADLIVLPYREIYQSAVLIMAMSYGRAVLVADLAPMMEVISDGVNGLSFRAGDTGALAGALAEALTDLPRLNELGSHALDDMRENYGWEQVGKRVSQVYSTVLKRPPG